MKKYLPSLVRGLAFCLIAALMLGYVSLILCRRTVTGPWDYTRMIGGFFRNEPADTCDVLAFGSSHMYCTLDPRALERETGLRSYVLATQQQPLTMTANYVELALEKQSPSLIILECFMLGRSETVSADAGVLHDGLDPLPLSAGKLRAVHELLPWAQRAEYLFPLIKYHDRWRELEPDFFDLSWLDDRDPERGYVELTGGTGAWCSAVDCSTAEPEPLSDSDRAALDRIAAAARAKNCRVLFLCAPYSECAQDLGKLAAARQYAGEHGIAFADMNACFDDLDLDNRTDFFDSGHLNRSGAAKAAVWLGALLTGELGLTPS